MTYGQKTTRYFITLFLIAAITPVFLAGCVTAVGDKKIMNTELIEQIKPGTSTKADVRQIMGEPMKTTFTDNNEELWDYTYTRGQTRATGFIPIVGRALGGADIKMATLTVRFTKEGIVKNVGKGETKGGGGGIQDLGK